MTPKVQPEFDLEKANEDLLAHVAEVARKLTAEGTIGNRDLLRLILRINKELLLITAHEDLLTATLPRYPAPESDTKTQKDPVVLARRIIHDVLLDMISENEGEEEGEGIFRVTLVPE